MLIGILQTGQAPAALKEEMGDYPDFFRRLLANRGLSFRNYHVENMQFPVSVHDCDGWLITGSRHGAYEDHPFIQPLENFIRKAVGEHVPMVGICFGHQIIAQALGGKVEKFKGGWAVGPQDYEFDGTHVTLNAWHQDQVVERPEGAEVCASNDFCENAALVYGDDAFTVQAHPEYDDAFIGGLLDHRGKGLLPDELIKETAAKLGHERDSGLLAAKIADFFKKPRASAT
ncbi:MAG: type 1 glutamine amidotransferase [Paracoccaceae bacterium]